LADDIMEPYRPIVDQVVLDMTARWPDELELNTEMKRVLLGIPVVDVIINGQRSPMMVAISQTTASLYKCYSGELRKVLYPEIPMS
jgi:CRISPR-associated protein Cas1